MADGARLTGVSTAVNIHINIEIAVGLRNFKRLQNNHPRGFTAEIILQSAIVDLRSTFARS